MNARNRSETLMSVPEVLPFPEPPTLKDLLTTDFNPTPSYRKEKEEKPLWVSPLFSVKTVDEPPPEILSVLQPPPEPKEEAPPPGDLQQIREDPQPIAEVVPISTVAIETEIVEVQVNPERPREVDQGTFGSPVIAQKIAHRQFLYWGNVGMSPRCLDRRRARIVAIMGCTLAGLACSIAIITMILT